MNTKYLCKDAIQCNPGHPPPFRILLANRFQMFLPFWNPQDKRLCLVSRYFLILKIKEPFFPQNTKLNRNAARWHYCVAYTRKVKNCRVGSFFPFLKILKIYTFMIRKPKPRFLSFGFWAIIIFLIILFNALLLTCQAVPSSIFDFLSFLDPKKSKVKNDLNCR